MEKNELIVTYGADALKMTAEVLYRSGLAQLIGQGASIGIKPNLVVAQPCSGGATTSPLIVQALIEYLLANGHKNLLVLEGAWVGASTRRAFKACGYEALSARYGVPLFDTKRDSYTSKIYEGIHMEVSDRALGVDFMINMPVLKGHCQTRITGALKNMKGCISDSEKRHFHTLGLHKPIAYLNTFLRNDFVLVDSLCGDLDFEEGGNPVQMNRIFCGRDPVLADAYIADCMGYTPAEIDYIGIAEQCGVGSADLAGAVITTLTKDETKAAATSSRKVQQLAHYAKQENACSACYANLIHALARLNGQRLLPAYAKNPVCIGQGFGGRQEDGIGVGDCTKGLSRWLPGCPPTATQMLEFLREGAKDNR